MGQACQEQGLVRSDWGGHQLALDALAGEDGAILAHSPLLAAVLIGPTPPGCEASVKCRSEFVSAPPAGGADKVDLEDLVTL